MREIKGSEGVGALYPYRSTHTRERGSWKIEERNKLLFFNSLWRGCFCLL